MRKSTPWPSSQKPSHVCLFFWRRFLVESDEAEEGSGEEKATLDSDGAGARDGRVIDGTGGLGIDDGGLGDDDGGLGAGGVDNGGVVGGEDDGRAGLLGGLRGLGAANGAVGNLGTARGEGDGLGEGGGGGQGGGRVGLGRDDDGGAEGQDAEDGGLVHFVWGGGLGFRVSKIDSLLGRRLSRVGRSG